jgi:Ca2+/H+ antiporter, TMEM165/GDT1 family
VSGFLFALIACLVASLGGRDQVLVARLAAAQGPRPALLVVALVAALASTALAAWAGARLLADLAPSQRGLGAALALIAAGADMLVLGPGKPPAEPTRSLFAAFVVLLAHQITDAARLLVLALAVATAAPLPAGMGGALGSGAALVSGWLAPALTGRIARPRRLAGLAMALLGGILLVRQMIA